MDFCRKNSIKLYNSKRMGIYQALKKKKSSKNCRAKRFHRSVNHCHGHGPQGRTNCCNSPPQLNYCHASHCCSQQNHNFAMPNLFHQHSTPCCQTSLPVNASCHMPFRMPPRQILNNFECAHCCSEGFNRMNQYY